MKEYDNKEEMSEIQKLLEELKDSIIGFENYKKYFEKVKSSDAVIITQINNRMRDYKEIREKFNEAVSKDSFKQLLEDNFVPREIFDYTRMMNRNIMEAFSWKSLQEEMYSIIFKKLFVVLDDARALDIKRDALKEMRNMETQKQEMFIEVFNNMSNMFKESVNVKFKNYDEKLFNLVMMNDEEHRKDRREMFNSLKQVMFTLSGISKSDKEKLLAGFSSQSDEVSKADRLFPPRARESEKKEVKDTFYDYDNDDDNDEDDGNDDIVKKMKKVIKSKPKSKSQEPIGMMKGGRVLREDDLE